VGEGHAPICDRRTWLANARRRALAGCGLALRGGGGLAVSFSPLGSGPDTRAGRGTLGVKREARGAGRGAQTRCPRCHTREVLQLVSG
jgi:hypothetical protein